MFLDGSLVVDMTRNRSLPTAPEQVIGVCTMEAAHDGEPRVCYVRNQVRTTSAYHCPSST